MIKKNLLEDKLYPATGDQINFKDATNHTLIRITDEGTVGSITIPPGSSAPSVTNNKLYNISGTLYFLVVIHLALQDGHLQLMIFPMQYLADRVYFWVQTQV